MVCTSQQGGGPTNRWNHQTPPKFSPTSISTAITVYQISWKGSPYYLLQRVRAIQDRSWSIVRVRIVHRARVYICPAETTISCDHWWVDPLCCGGHNNHCNCLMILNHCSIGLIVSPIQNEWKNCCKHIFIIHLLTLISNLYFDRRVLKSHNCTIPLK